MKANSNTGLTQPDIFYFGSAVGETENVAGDYGVSITDELLARNNPAGISPGTLVTNRFDFNRDGTVSVVDQLLVRNNITTNASRLKQITVPAVLTDEGMSLLAKESFEVTGQQPMAPTVSNSLSSVAQLHEEPSNAGNLMQTESGQAIRQEFSQTLRVGRRVPVGVSDDLLELISTSQRRG